jgi:hypothetical protein
MAGAITPVAGYNPALPSVSTPAVRRSSLNLGVLLLIGIAALFLLAILAVVKFVGSFQFVQPGPVVSEARRVQLGAAGAADVTLEMGAGTINLSGGAGDLLEADFSYNIPQWKPQVSYTVSGDRGTLQVRQPDSKIYSGSDAKNTWELRLNNDVPSAVHADFGAAVANLQLGGLALSRLDVKSGVGDMTIDLTGAWKQDLDATVEGGVGKITLRLPADTGVHVTAERGVGRIDSSGLKVAGDTYTNAVYGQTEHRLNIAIATGVGVINLIVVK